jgi:hypothetical protein
VHRDDEDGRMEGKVMDTAPYNEEHKKGPTDVINVSWAIGKFFLVHFIFLLLTIDDDDYPCSVENR